ncbi:hypothetical protein TPE_2672 [Treponema pedis str. T A4]|uniref:Uncharacterized protein n=1 Tax=Treponema pedis str. T A4 TaxID=1291379 RepID=S6A987_9SPIR|nr:hypothetical protein TPE_2672 [Treponema pedis str. T A4]
MPKGKLARFFNKYISKYRKIQAYINSNADYQLCNKPRIT